jgi:hypothetical protein
MQQPQRRALGGARCGRQLRNRQADDALHLQHVGDDGRLQQLLLRQRLQHAHGQLRAV